MSQIKPRHPFYDLCPKKIKTYQILKKQKIPPKATGPYNKLYKLKFC